MRDPWDDADHARRYATFARTSMPRAPRYAAMATVFARERSLSSLLAHAPPQQRQPVLPLAAIHLLLLSDPDEPLARWYPTITAEPRAPDDAELATELISFVARHEANLMAIIASHHVQTNEIGRCALLLPAFAAIADETGRALAHVDVGASAGLTLLLPHLGYDYERADDVLAIGDADIRITCGVRGDLATPLPRRTPSVARSIGLDPRPIDVSDPDAARWLLACCWPDELDRFERLRAAIDLARMHPPVVGVGTAADIRSVIDDLDRDVQPVVTTTWVMTYLQPEERLDLLTRLDDVGAERDLDWVFAESPAQTPELPHPPELRGEHITAVVWVSWRSGRRRVVHVARAHPHGRWMHALGSA